MRLPASKTAALHRNVAHRAACLALYRRLLKHTQKTTTLTLPSTSTETSPPPPPPSQLRRSIKSIVTREFRKYGTRDTAIVKIRAALTLGYKAEKCLRLATAVPPDPIELARLSAFLNLYRQRREAPPLVRMQAANITVQPKPKPKPPKPINPNLSLLPFDLRFKPTIIGGNTIPFIRYTGTKQSPELSGILNKKIKQKVKRDDLLDQLKQDREYANAEDIFENELWNEAGREWRKENPDENPTVDGYWKTEVTRAQMRLQLKLWAHQVSVWERSGRCMDRIEDHKRRVKEFMAKLKAEKMKKKGTSENFEQIGDSGSEIENSVGKVGVVGERDIGGLGSDVQTFESTREPRVEGIESQEQYSDSIDSQMEALNAQLKAAGIDPGPQPIASAKKPRAETKKWEPQPRPEPEPELNDMDAEMEALNAQLRAAGFSPTSRIPKPRKSSHSNNFESRRYSRDDNFEPRDYNHRNNKFEPRDHSRKDNFRSRDHNSRGGRTDTRQNSYSRSHYDNYDDRSPREPRPRYNNRDNNRLPRESKPRSKRQPSPKRQEDEHHGRQEGQKENRHAQRSDNGAMLAGKGVRSRRGLDIGKVFGSEEPK
ncbi:hypothetical protein TWF102_001597 [Orbilia oligospora]|uniref:Uncharacterized protein n=1 Tax=Orbilia oligospora TaxID=2813651 RepID=A0A7C8K7N3_ORBOL|nr:hypothetical protein TWF103_004786 [Orbilia oligospora]KAF3081634.1 hypothetical protein TWF102_001597 [Orbilia oligospora]KAF3123772.1 hypothetical protein TWF594_002203 [Orbilia oligospora]KAF3144602.1 hypothetical protein TWF703_008588 [Orbilia oligospora]